MYVINITAIIALCKLHRIKKERWIYVSLLHINLIFKTHISIYI